MNEMPPFGAPPASFVQTGNQVTVNEVPFAESAPGPFANPGSPEPFSSGSTPINEPFQNGFSQPNQPEKSKYQIFDMFWMLNPKAYSDPKQLAQGESHFVVVSYNISFGNLRVSFFNLTNNSIQKNIVYLENLKRTVSGTIYPATAFNVSKSIRVSTTCLEQLFRQIPGANWQQERPVCVIEKNEELIRFTVKDPKFGNYYYDFSGWQREAFLHACEFTYTRGFELMAQQHLK